MTECQRCGRVFLKWDTLISHMKNCSAKTSTFIKDQAEASDYSFGEETDNDTPSTGESSDSDESDSSYLPKKVNID